jgi:hypothetical protein
MLDGRKIRKLTCFFVGPGFWVLVTAIKMCTPAAEIHQVKKPSLIKSVRIKREIDQPEVRAIGLFTMENPQLDPPEF